MTLNELKVGVRVLDFLVNPPHGRVPVAVIYDGDNKASADDAEAIRGWLDSGVNPVKAQLVPGLIDVRRLGAATGYSVGIIAEGTHLPYSVILEFAQRNHTLLISSNPSCAQAGLCTVEVTGSPRIEVTVNRSVALACGVDFTEAFRMMVREY